MFLMYSRRILHRNATHLVKYPQWSPSSQALRAFASNLPPRQGKVEDTGQGGSQGQNEKVRRNNALALGAGAATLAGIYYYYTHEDRDRNRGLSPSERAARDEEEIRRKAREAKDNVRQAVEAGKASGEYRVRQAQDKYGEVKAAVKNRAEETGQEMTERVRQGIQEGQTKLDEYKDAAEKSLSDVRKASEQKYEETKGGAGQKAEEARNTGWKLFGFNGQKVEETKRRSAEKVAETAEDVKRRADTEKQT
ncbi:hypothetical protein SCLCIDRAFT_1222007 [Scleroderma citrinum Foug A]|uniref:Uncharacterized protein n=1 Tax=Scleroderma citrinum Foug A TaxID=1036808 RepID=A0A0C2YXT1_9AGAM|nr:hypothetical protein SCLCIDRAFT_1222007 [Scleroderma citrinum Foug A]